MTASTLTASETLVLRGVVDRTFFASPTFSAGLLRTDDGTFVKFRGRFCASEGDAVALVGTYTRDPKYGLQFDVHQLSYDLPETPEGLVQYLASHPAFKGIGYRTAQRLVEYAGDVGRLDELIRDGIDELRTHLRIPAVTLEILRDAWIAHGAENRVRTFLAGFGLTHHQMDVMLQTFGDAVVGILRGDPYLLIKHLDGFGFKRVDQIARKMGTPKTHPGRIEAAISYCLGEQISSGHTWVGGAELLEAANDVLLLDELDSLERIRHVADGMLAEGDLAADGQAITRPGLLAAESRIRDCFREHARRKASRLAALPGFCDPGDLNPRQREAYRSAVTHRIAVISGGAGTGKTYVVARLARAFRTAGLEVALCAPTGKAAKRIEELMRAAGVPLEAQTIHRLLQYDGHAFHRASLSERVVGYDAYGNETERAPVYHAVLADESSMIDVPLMTELVQRIDFQKTRLILVGDHNQLPPVGPGNVLRDILHHNLAPITVLTDVVRQAGVLKANSMKVLSGVVAPSAVNDPGWIVIDCFKEADRIQAYLRDLVLESIPKRLGYDPVEQVQIITPTHKGPLGTKAINEMMQRLLHGPVDRKFAIGDKVIQTVNDYDLGVMNGTIGRVVDIEGDAYHVEFDGEGCHKIGGEKLGNVQLAYCLTAHKAQGSEFPCVVVLCHKSHYFADRNWLYTAVTRAAESCILVGDRWGIHHAAAKNHTVSRRTLLSLWAGREQHQATPGDNP